MERMYVIGTGCCVMHKNDDAPVTKTNMKYCMAYSRMSSTPVVVKTRLISRKQNSSFAFALRSAIQKAYTLNIHFKVEEEKRKEKHIKCKHQQTANKMKLVCPAATLG